MAVRRQRYGVEQRVSSRASRRGSTSARDRSRLRNHVVDTPARREHHRAHRVARADDRLRGGDVHIEYDASSPQAEASLYDLRQSPTSGARTSTTCGACRRRGYWRRGCAARRLATSVGSSISPRLSAKYFVTKEFALTAAVGRFTQWTHSLAREDIPVRLFDFWVASDSVTPVSSAWHYVTGAENVALADARYVRVEGFYKRYGNLLEGNPQDDPARHGDEFIVVNGDSYGADVLLRQFERGPFSGWISYTYAVAARERELAALFPRARPPPRLQLRRRAGGSRNICSACGTDTRRERRTPTSSARSCGGSTIRDSIHSARAAAAVADRIHRRHAQWRAAADDAAARPRRHATLSGARHDDLAVSERRERVQREERVYLRLRLLEESADATGDLAVPASALRRCLDSLLESRSVARLGRAGCARWHRASWRRSAVPQTDAEGRRARGAQPQRGEPGSAFSSER